MSHAVKQRFDCANKALDTVYSLMITYIQILIIINLFNHHIEEFKFIFFYASTKNLAVMIRVFGIEDID